MVKVAGGQWPCGQADRRAADRGGGVRTCAEPASGTDDLARRHLDVEEAAERSGVGRTHLRPGMFMTNTLQWTPGIAAEGVVRQPFPDTTAAPVHEADIAAVTVAALLDPTAHAGAAYTLSGPEAQSQLDRVRIIAEVLGREVRFEEQSREAARVTMLDSPWMTEPMADSLLTMLAEATRTHGRVLSGVPEVAGRPALSFADWVEDHRSDFTDPQPRRGRPA